MSEARLQALERLLIEVQFDHPRQRVARVDEFYAHQRSDVRRVLLYALRSRTFWAHRDGEVNAARAVAYQNIAGMLTRVLDDWASPTAGGEQQEGTTTR